MNVVVDEAEEIPVGKAATTDKTRRSIGELGALLLRTNYSRAGLLCVVGRILLKGDNITLIQPAL